MKGEKTNLIYCWRQCKFAKAFLEVNLATLIKRISIFCQPFDAVILLLGRMLYENPRTTAQRYMYKTVDCNTAYNS